MYMRITVDGMHCEVSTKRKCDPQKWNAYAGRMKGVGDAVKQYNAYMDTLQQKVFEAKRKLIETDQALSAEAIKNNLLGKKEEKEKHFLLEIFLYHKTP